MTDLINRLENIRYNTILIYVTIAVIFILDLLTPSGFAVWILYIIPLLMNPYKAIKRSRLYLIAALMTVLLWVCYFTDSPGTAPRIALYNRIIMSFIIWIITYVQQQRANTHQRHIISEEKAKKSEELFRQTFERAATGIAHILPDGRWLKVNDKYCDMMGYSRDELSKFTFMGLTHPEDLKHDLEMRRKLLNGEIESFSMEKRYIRKDGSIRWAILTCSLGYEESTGLKYMISVLEEITELKKLQQELLEQHTLLETVIADIPAGILLLKGNDLRIELVNDAYRAIAPGKGMLGEKFSEVWAEVYTSLEKLYKKVMETGETYQAEDAMYMIKRSHEGPLEKAYFTFTLTRVELPGNNKWGILNTTIETTERVKAIEALKESEARLREAQKLAHIGSYSINYENYKVEFSEELFRIFGWDPETKAVTYEDVISSVHPDDKALLTEAINKSIEEKTSIELDYRIVTPEGEVKYLYTKRDPVFDENGKLTGTFGTSLDITSRKLQELELEGALSKLQESESRLIEAQTLAHVGSFSYDIITGQIVWTKETFNIYEIDPEKGVPAIEELTSYWHPEDMPWVLEAIKDGMENNHLINFECKLLLKGNKVKYIQYIGKPVYNNEGKAIKRAGAVVDITERKLIQLKLEDTLKHLKENEAKLLDAQKLAKMGSYTIDFKNNGKMEWSDEMYNIWEVDKTKPLPTVDEVWKLVHPDDWEELNRVLTNDLPGNEKVETEFRILFPDKRVKYVHIATRVVFDEAGSLIKREGVEMDITERKLAQIRLERTLQELNRSNKELEQFAYIASHDLQEPLRMVSSYMAMLDKKYSNKLDEKAREFIHFAVDGSKRMSNLIKDLLIYSRVTTKAGEFREVDLNEIFNDVRRDLQILVKEKNARINSKKLPTLKADPTQMRQLLQNLIGNAIKFQGDRTPEVMIKAKEIENGFLFSIKDNGIGIDPQFYDRIFQVFQRLHERDKYPGTGIGLAVCKKIVERHGGKIWVESEPGKGTIFYFTIHKNNEPTDPEVKDDLEILSA